MSILFVFIDGLGLAPSGETNPLTALPEGPLACLSGRKAGEGFRLLAADACLGMPGLPQSATGGTALFTGENAPRLVGSHLQGMPNSVLRDLICRKNILRRAREHGARVGFANAYSPPFFQRGRTRRRSVTTVMTESAGLRLRDLEDLKSGNAVYRDFTNRALREHGFEVDELSAAEAGGRLGRLAKSMDLLLYEYFQTDKIGHRGTIEEARDILFSLNRFVWSALVELDPVCDGFVICSDHGNIEEMGTSTHTHNPVPVLLWGKASRAWLERREGAVTICDVTPAILSMVSNI